MAAIRIGHATFPRDCPLGIAKKKSWATENHSCFGHLGNGPAKLPDRTTEVTVWRSHFAQLSEVSQKSRFGPARRAPISSPGRHYMAGNWPAIDLYLHSAIQICQSPCDWPNFGFPNFTQDPSRWCFCPVEKSLPWSEAQTRPDPTVVRSLQKFKIGHVWPVSEGNTLNFI